jgi:hypothetical protein
MIIAILENPPVFIRASIAVINEQFRITPQVKSRKESHFF